MRSRHLTPLLLRARQKNHARANRSRRFRRPFLESLESRQLLTVAAAADLSSLNLDTRAHRADSLIVQFRDGTSSPGSLAAHQLAANLQQEWSITPGMRRVDLASNADLAAAILAFRQDPNVAFVEPDYRVSLEQVPNDPNFGLTWGLHNEGQTGGIDDADIDAPEAWDVEQGSSDTIVAVIDTGVDYTHPDLKDNIWTNTKEANGKPGIDDDGNGYVDDVHGYDFVNRDGDPMDDHFHGTHVAGTIGAVGDNGIGITGVNWHVSIMALKFLDSTGGGYESDAIAALNYAVANGAVISNNSWGGLGYSPAFETALKNAAAKGHIFVAAAGNDGWNNDQDAFYPAGYNVANVVSVAATDSSDNLAWFSNYGVKSVDLAAPGVDIYSTFPTKVTQAMRDGGFGPNYGTISGTSMATPHVAGVMALVHSNFEKTKPGFTYEDVIDRVKDTVDIIDGASKTITGGRVNAAAAVGNAGADTTGPRVLSLDPTTTVGSIDHIRVRFSEGIDPATVSLEDIISLTGPDGDITPVSFLPVPGNNRQFELTFPAQSTLGTYTLVLGSDITDLAGNLLDQNRSGEGGQPGVAPGGDSYSGEFQISNVLRFGTDVERHWDGIEFLFGFGTPSEFPIDVDANIAITDLNLQFQMYYPRAEELKMYLRSPSGTEVTLVDQFDAYGQWFQNTILDDEAPLPFSAGTSPYAGSYRPSSSLSAFNGENAAGTWTLVIESWIDLAYFADSSDGYIYSLYLDVAGDNNGTPPVDPPPTDPPPGNRAPVAIDDALSGEVNTRLAVPVATLLANDRDPDGDALTIAFVGNPTHGSVSLDQDQLITFTPTADFQGLATFQYILSDGFAIDTGTVTIDFQPVFQWHNTDKAADVDHDGEVTATDVIAIINFINATGAGPLSQLSAQFGLPDVRPDLLYDVTADDNVAADDVVAVINYINAQPTSPPTTTQAVKSTFTDADVDAALLSLLTEGNDKRK